MKLIDLEYALKQIEIGEFEHRGIFESDSSHIKDFLNALPTVDVVEVVHGRWTEAEDGDGAVCSVCGEDFCNVYLEVERFLYCPNCGAKMDGD